MFGTLTLPTCTPVWLKSELIFVPNSAAPPTMAKATRIRTRAYSIAFAPRSSRVKRPISCRMLLSIVLGEFEPASAGTIPWFRIQADASRQSVLPGARRTAPGRRQEGHDVCVRDCVRVALFVELFHKLDQISEALPQCTHDSAGALANPPHNVLSSLYN